MHLVTGATGHGSALVAWPAAAACRRERSCREVSLAVPTVRGDLSSPGASDAADADPITRTHGVLTGP